MSYIAPLARELPELYARSRADARGDLPTCIPELSSADPNLFGVCLTGLDGELDSAGDANALFTIQSVSKPFVYALAIADRGLDVLRVGLPAKSGVSGGLLAVSPSRFGIGLFSPLLDERGNSVRAIEICRAPADRFDIHLMRTHEREVPVPRGRRGAAQSGR